MNTLAKYTQQPNKEDNINISIHSLHPFEVNENLNSSEVLLTVKNFKILQWTCQHRNRATAWSTKNRHQVNTHHNW